MDEKIEEAKRVLSEWELGKMSAHHESGGRGAGVISSGKGDLGGVSYGEYQLSSNSGTLGKYLAGSRYREQFAGMTPATPAFNAKWKELARTDAGFGREQHEFIGKTHYGAQQEKLKTIGLDLSDRGRAVHDALWSTANQYGGDLTVGIFKHGLEEKFGMDFALSALSDKDIVGAVQDYKLAHNDTLFKSSSDLWEGLRARAVSEKADLVALAEREELLALNGVSVPIDLARRAEGSHSIPSGRPASAAGSAGKADAIRALQRELNELGAHDSGGHALVVDGRFGPRTSEAIADFQRDKGLPVTGKPDGTTREAVHAYAVVASIEQRRAERSTVQEMAVDGAAVSREKSQSSLTFLDAQHPDHRLYRTIREHLPPSVADDKAAEVTLAAKQGGVRAGAVEAIGVHGDRIFVFGTAVGAQAYVNLESPAPPIDVSARQSDAFDRQQAQQREQAAGVGARQASALEM